MAKILSTRTTKIVQIRGFNAKFFQIEKYITCDLSLFQSMMQIKERKDMEESFKKAQKPWAKLLQKVNKSKQDYHGACKAEKSASNQERNASGDTSISPDQVTEQFFFFTKKLVI